MNAARTIFAVLLLTAAARADEAKDRLARAIADLGEQDGYVLTATWKIVVERLDKPAEGKVESVVREKGDFLRLVATFETGDLTIYQKGSRIAGQNQETKEWGPIDEDKKAKFVTRMFNLKSFLTEVASVSPATVFLQDQDECQVIKAVAEMEALKKLLGDSETGQALVNNELHDPTMTVLVLVNRKTRLVDRIEVDIEGDAKGQEIKKPGNGAEQPGGDWEEAPDKPPQPGDPKPEPKKEEPPKEPIVQHVKIHIGASVNYKRDRNIEIPDAVKKVLGLN
ncbi:MAG: hypothetical protein HYY18_05015 [Planctomycetes bacterium]|nr:hypothetical protein [Planctomycetota bacterium]